MRTLLKAVLACLLFAPWVGATEKVEEESPGAAPEATPEATPEARTTGIYRKGFRFTTADERFSIRLMGAAQLRYTYGWLDDSVEGNPLDFSNFYLRRARLWFDGHAYNPRTTYYFHIQLEPASGAHLHDAWVQYNLHDLFQVGLGRNKIAYGLEFLNSGFGLDFVDRSVMYGETDVDVGGGLVKYPGGGTAPFSLNARDAFTGFPTGGLTLYRSQGVQIQGRRAPGTDAFDFEYQAGVWNGRGTRSLSNVGNGHLFAARVGLYPRGWIDWRSQGDMAYSKRPKVGLLASAYAGRSPRTRNAAGETVPRYESRDRGVSTALEARFRGFSGDLEWSREWYEIDDSTLVGEREFQRQGWRLALGCFLSPSKLEIVGRYAQIQRLRAPSITAAMNSGMGVASIRSATGELHHALERRIRELTLGLNLYLSRDHQHKVFVDTSRLTREFAGFVGGGDEGLGTPPDQRDTRVRAMLQLKF